MPITRTTRRLAMGNGRRERRLSHRQRIVGFAVALLSTVGLSVGLPSTAHATPACALKVTVETGIETLRPASAFTVALKIWTGSEYKWVFLHTNGNTMLPGGTQSWSSKTYFVAPQVPPDGRGFMCIDSRDIRGVEIGIIPVRFYNRWDQWDLRRLTITDSVSNEVFFESHPLVGLPKRLSWGTAFPASVWWPCPSGRCDPFPL